MIDGAAWSETWGQAVDRGTHPVCRVLMKLAWLPRHCLSAAVEALFTSCSSLGCKCAPDASPKMRRNKRASLDGMLSLPSSTGD